MPWGNYLYDVGFNLASGQTATKFRAVKLDGNSEEVAGIAAISDDIVGFAQYGVTAAEVLRGKGVSVRVQGVTEAEAAGAIAVGARVQLEANGTVSQLVVASGKRFVGKCVGSPAVNAGDRIALLITSDGPLA